MSVDLAGTGVETPEHRISNVFDPFGPSADPLRYVPRAASERALEALVHSVRERGRSALLCGIPGIGKTLLLRLLGQRLAPELRSVYLPYASLPEGALCAWALSLLDGPPSYDPSGALLRYARQPRDEGTGLVLLIDDAETLPESSGRRLRELAIESEGALRLVAATHPTRAEGLIDTLGELDRVELLAPMTAEETACYVQEYLLAACLPERIAASFDAEALASLHERASGLPGRVNAEASALLRAASKRAAAEASAPAPAETEAAFERAAGRLALAQSEVPLEGEPGAAEAAFERAAGRLALAQSEMALEGEAGAAEATPEPAATEAALEPAIAEATPEPAAEELAPPQPEIAEAAPSAAAPSERPEPAAEAGAWAALERTVAAPPEGAPAATARWAAAGRPRALLFAAFFVVGASAGVLVSRYRGVESGLLATVATPEAPTPATPEPSLAVTPEPAAAAEAVATVSVQINATPWATISVDGEEVGITPLAGLQLSEGLHAFEARYPDGRVVERAIKIDAANRFVAFP